MVCLQVEADRVATEAEGTTSRMILHSHVCICVHFSIPLSSWHTSLSIWLGLLIAGCSQGSHTSSTAVGFQEARVEATRSGKGHIKNWHSITPTTFYCTKSHKPAQIHGMEK